jgi:protein transport protein SEC61 subunit alpha
VLTMSSIIYSYFEIAAKEGDMAGLKGMVMG